jgi:hypothetical protein
MANYYYEASGGITTGGEANPITSPYWTAPVGSEPILMGGEASVVSPNWHYEGSGSIVVSGDATENITAYRERGTGGIVIGGDADEAITAYRYRPTGGITTGGTALALYSINLSTVASGGMVLGGVAPVVVTVGAVGDGGIVIDGESSVTLSADYSMDVEWDIRIYFDAVHNFTWDVGELPIKVYQVEGCCKPNDGVFGGCEVLPLDTNDPLNCDQRFLQTIFARNLGEVCDFLTTSNWKWPICSIKKFSTSAFDLVSINGSQPPECNTLDEVEYCQIPECFEFCLQTDGKTNMGMAASVIDNVYQYTGTGGIQISGGYDPVRHVVGSGGIEVSGESYSYPKPFIFYYTGSGGIEVSGEANVVSSNWDSASSGGIVLSGQANVKSSKWHYTATGGVAMSGSARTFPRPVYVSDGKSDVYPTYAGIRVSGFAGYPILARTSGGITLYGSATANILSSHHEGSGGISMGGESSVVSPDWHYEGSGGIVMGGVVGYNYLSMAYYVDDSVPITLGGDASYRNSIDGDFWYTALTDTPITLGGSADYRISQLKYKPSSNPNIVLGGGALITSTYRIADDTNMGMGSHIEGLEVNYSLDGQTAPSIVAPTQTVNTTCGQCNQVALKLNFKHNLEFGAIFREFLIRNGYTVPQSFPLFYNKRLDSWQGTLHYSGVAADNLNNLESWRINVDWACTSQYADDDFSASVWRFSLLFTRRNTTTNLDFDTRLLILFPADEICLTADRDGLDFSFQFDTRRQTISTRENIVVDVVNLYDNVGLFRSNYWQTNKLNIRISEDYIVDNLNKTDITFIIPEKQPQFSI